MGFCQVPPVPAVPTFLFPGCSTGYKPKKPKKENLVNAECAKNPENDGVPNDDNEKENEQKPEEEQEKYALFGFPKHDTEPELRARWIARVPRCDKKWLQIKSNHQEKSCFVARDIFCLLISSLKVQTATVDENELVVT